MSHISRFEAQQRRVEVLQTPFNVRGQSVKDFSWAPSATPTTFMPTTTPGRRRIDAGTDLIAEIEEEANTESLKEIKGVNWKIHSASPLFKYDPEKSLEHLSTYINQQGFTKVTVQKIPGLRGNREDPESFKIQSSHPDFKILFVSVHSQEFDLKSEAAVFPLVLSKGLEKAVESFLLLVERFFDCVIYPHHLSPVDLKWMSALWAGAPSKKFDQVNFTYIMEGDMPIDIKFDADQLKEVMTKVKTDNGLELGLVEMEKFHELLESSLEQIYGIKFANLHLESISLPALSAFSDGHVKVQCVDKVKAILGFLTSLCQEKYVTSANPRLGLAVHNIL